MNPNDNAGYPRWSRGAFWASRAMLVFIGFAAIASLLLFSEHRAHIFGALIWLIPFSCIFLHMFMHGHHGRHHIHEQHDADHGGENKT